MVTEEKFLEVNNIHKKMTDCCNVYQSLNLYMGKCRDVTDFKIYITSSAGSNSKELSFCCDVDTIKVIRDSIEKDIMRLRYEFDQL